MGGNVRRGLHFEHNIYWVPAFYRVKSHAFIYLGIVQCTQCKKYRVVEKRTYLKQIHKHLCFDCVNRLHKRGIIGRERFGLHKKWGVVWIPVRKSNSYSVDYMGIVQCPSCKKWRLIYKQSFYKHRTDEVPCVSCKKIIRIKGAWDLYRLVDESEYYYNLAYIKNTLRGHDPSEHGKSAEPTPLEETVWENETYYIKRFTRNIAV